MLLRSFPSNSRKGNRPLRAGIASPIDFGLLDDEMDWCGRKPVISDNVRRGRRLFVLDFPLMRSLPLWLAFPDPRPRANEKRELDNGDGGCVCEFRTDCWESDCTVTEFSTGAICLE